MINCLEKGENQKLKIILLIFYAGVTKLCMHNILIYCVYNKIYICFPLFHNRKINNNGIFNLSDNILPGQMNKINFTKISFKIIVKLLFDSQVCDEFV